MMHSTTPTAMGTRIRPGHRWSREGIKGCAEREKPCRASDWRNFVSVPIYIIDAFADRVFRGNPAAVCLLGRECDVAWMQTVGGGVNFSGTAFWDWQGR